MIWQEDATMSDTKELFPNSVRPRDFSDMGNAHIYVREYGEDVIYTDSMGWLCWDGKRFERSEHRALELAEDLCNRMLDEALEEYRNALLDEVEAKTKIAASGDDKKDLETAAKKVQRSKEYLAHANTTRRSARVKAILELARPYLVQPGVIMDADPWELNTQAGIINLVTGDFRPCCQDAHCTKITAVSRSQKGAELWDEFLDRITCGDGSLKGFLQLVVGMSLFGKVYQEGAIFAVGDGKNGKSTFFNAIGSVLGDYTGYIDIDIITTKGANDKASLATLRGKRLVIAGELEEGRRLSAATIKKIASTDPFQVEEKYKQPEMVRPSHTFCLFTNYLPRVGSTDTGTWRRIIVVPFRAVIQGSGTIQNYADYLVEHAGGAILAWAVEGAQNFARNHFTLDIPDIVEEATDAYRARENWLENFLEECCVFGPNRLAPSGRLYSAYKAWSDELKDYTRSSKDFSAEMERLGFEKRKLHGTPTFIGIELRNAKSPATPCYDRGIL